LRQRADSFGCRTAPRGFRAILSGRATIPEESGSNSGRDEMRPFSALLEDLWRRPGGQAALPFAALRATPSVKDVLHRLLLGAPALTRPGRQTAPGPGTVRILAVRLERDQGELQLLVPPRCFCRFHSAYASCVERWLRW
jgi:hypothetical protein